MEWYLNHNGKILYCLAVSHAVPASSWEVTVVFCFVNGCTVQRVQCNPQETNVEGMVSLSLSVPSNNFGTDRFSRKLVCHWRPVHLCILYQHGDNENFWGWSDTHVNDVLMDHKKNYERFIQATFSIAVWKKHVEHKICTFLKFDGHNC
jgi:hypothetical protein